MIFKQYSEGDIAPVKKEKRRRKMGRDKFAIDRKEKKKISIVEGLTRLSKGNLTITLNEREKEQFEKARLAEEKARQVNFVLGGRIKL